MASLKAGVDLQLDILDLATGGRGLGRLPDGRVVFVAGALAGEKVLAHLTKVKNDYAEAKTLEILSPSPQRVEPKCPLYGRCGGCDLMHLDYAAQVEAKAGWVRRALWRLEGLPPAQVLPSPLAWGYRNRLRLQVQEGGVGYFARGGHQLVPLEHCPVAAEGANRVLPALAKALAQPPWDGLDWVEVLAGPQEALLTLGWNQPQAPPEAEAQAASLAQVVGAKGARLCREGELGPWPLQPGHGLPCYQEDGLELSAFPGIFSQVNFAANQVLVGQVLEAAQALPAGQALDLYAGSGNFGLPLAARGWRVLAVEGDLEAGQAAVAQAHSLGLQDKLVMQAAEANAALAALAQAGRDFDLVVLDPPRMGAKDLMAGILALDPRRVVYVSCHPAALGRDAKALAVQGYRPTSLSVLDIFPQTGHVEAVLVLDRPA